jgi:hypothetical protein
MGAVAGERTVVAAVLVAGSEKAAADRLGLSRVRRGGESAGAPCAAHRNDLSA